MRDILSSRPPTVRLRSPASPLPPKSALLVTDVDMPVMNGLELLRALSFREDLPKLVISGAAAAPPLAGLNVSGFFSKPLNLAQFKHTVARLVNHQAAAT